MVFVMFQSDGCVGSVLVTSGVCDVSERRLCWICPSDKWYLVMFQSDGLVGSVLVTSGVCDVSERRFCWICPSDKWCL